MRGMALFRSIAGRCAVLHTVAMKSSYELAMERLKQKDGALKPLSDDQKKAIAEIESRAKAQAAEVEIMSAQKVAEARAKGDPDAAAKLLEQKAIDLARIRSRADDDKARVREG